MVGWAWLVSVWRALVWAFGPKREGAKARFGPVGARLLTAGSAKKEIPKRAQKEAMILPGQVMGTVSP